MLAHRRVRFSFGYWVVTLRPVSVHLKSFLKVTAKPPRYPI